MRIDWERSSVAALYDDQSCLADVIFKWGIMQVIHFSGSRLFCSVTERP